MEKFKRILPAILMILFELAVGVLLLINPERFTTAVFIAFGCVLMVCSLILLIRYLKARKEASGGPAGKQAGALTLFIAIVTFCFGAVFAFGSSMLYGMTGLLLVFYGAVMIVKGVFKISDYFALKKEGFGVSALRPVVGVLSVILGGLIIFNPFGALEAVFMIAAIGLIAEAVLDIVALALGVRVSNMIEAEAKDIEE